MTDENGVTFVETDVQWMSPSAIACSSITQMFVCLHNKYTLRLQLLQIGVTH